MWGAPLHVDQPVRAITHQINQAGQGHLGGIRPPVEHGLAGEQPANGHPVEPTGQTITVPTLH